MAGMKAYVAGRRIGRQTTPGVESEQRAAGSV